MSAATPGSPPWWAQHGAGEQKPPGAQRGHSSRLWEDGKGGGGKDRNPDPKMTLTKGTGRAAPRPRGRRVTEPGSGARPTQTQDGSWGGADGRASSGGNPSALGGPQASLRAGIQAVTPGPAGRHPGGPPKPRGQAGRGETLPTFLIPFLPFSSPVSTSTSTPPPARALRGVTAPPRPPASLRDLCHSGHRPGHGSGQAGGLTSSPGNASATLKGHFRPHPDFETLSG